MVPELRALHQRGRRAELTLDGQDHLGVGRGRQRDVIPPVPGRWSQLPDLKTPGVDSCLRGTTLTQQMSAIADAPASGSFYWYLVRANNAQGVGPAGFSRIQGNVRARIQESSGPCP